MSEEKECGWCRHFKNLPYEDIKHFSLLANPYGYIGDTLEDHKTDTTLQEDVGENLCDQRRTYTVCCKHKVIIPDNWAYKCSTYLFSSEKKEVFEGKLREQRLAAEKKTPGYRITELEKRIDTLEKERRMYDR